MRFGRRRSVAELWRCTQLLAACAFLLHCSAPTAEELAGAYFVSYGFAEENLTLHESGTYEQRILVTETGAVTVHSGTWTYVEYGLTHIVSLADPLLVQSLSGQFRPNYAEPVDGTWGLLIKRFPRLRLAVSEDLGLYFERQSGPGSS
jgi:hypothetical protein